MPERPGVLEVRASPDPEPVPGEIRVRVETAGINFVDVLARMGLTFECNRPDFLSFLRSLEYEQSTP